MESFCLTSVVTLTKRALHQLIHKHCLYINFYNEKIDKKPRRVTLLEELSYLTRAPRNCFISIFFPLAISGSLEGSQIPTADN